jgi:hypothetical protein
MTNEQMAIVKARAIVIKMEETVKVLEELNEKSDLMWDWWSENSLNFTEEQDTEYLELYAKSKELDKKIKDLS